MDRVAQVLNEISVMPELVFLDRRTGFLDDVAEIYERHGAGTTKAFLLTQHARRRPEVPLLLKIVEKFDGCPEIRLNRAIGRQIIKCLLELKGASRNDQRTSVQTHNPHHRTPPNRGEKGPTLGGR